MLTATQQKVLKFLQDYARENGMPPTRVEIAAHFGWASPNAAQCHLKAIKARGCLQMLPRRARGLRILGS